MPARTFGQLPTGEIVTAHTLRGSSGLVLECLNYGGIVTRLFAPDREGQLADVVLGCATLADYLSPQPYFGAIAGRVAGRITGARFTLDGCEHRLAPNDTPNHLHGGTRGFDKYLWHAEPVARADGAPSLRLSRLSPDGEEGYPGNVTVAVTYTITADNTFLIETAAHTDRATPFSLTHHSYFNLAGEGRGSAENHTLAIAAASYAPADDSMGLSGRRESVTLDNDLRYARRLGDIIPRLHKRHGDLYFLSDSTTLHSAAVLADPFSGRILTVNTDETCLQLYCGTSFNRTRIGKSGQPYVRHAGVCLECEGYPDGVNTPALGDIVLRPGAPLRRTTAYAFTTAP